MTIRSMRKTPLFLATPSSRPEPIPDNQKLPVVVWGNGGCAADNLAHQSSNLEIASSAIMVITSGGSGKRGSTTAYGDYANVDADRIAASGMGCGGIEAYVQVGKVSAIGILNSGQFNEAGTNAVVPGITTPWVADRHCLQCDGVTMVLSFAAVTTIVNEREYATTPPCLSPAGGL
ncbi:cellulose-binding family ii [Moniliophthora roreri MCA 2997]|uniref:Cellulose-binding family ii n=1 Tax=Moniliophthora roreri (strain MCA 2997) TaxID=1381753 RepID=V2X1J1_MONRO|nr:cellulose-binding family ii [Moniliophthora roreri MCA 2997]